MDFFLTDGLRRMLLQKHFGEGEKKEQRCVYLFYGTY